METRLKIERLEGGRAFLRDEKNRLIVWPLNFLPPNSLAGQYLIMNIEAEGEEKKESVGAKEILNEIFSS